MWLALVAAMLSSPATAKEIKVPGLDVLVTVPDPPDGEMSPWGWTVGDVSTDVRLAMRNMELYTDVTFQAAPWQPDLSAIEDLAPQVLPLDDEDLQITPGEPFTTQHETLGDMLVLTADVHDSWMEMDRWSRVAVFAIEGNGVVVTATSSESAERAEEVLTTALGMVQVTNPPVPPAELPYGKVTADAGYTVDVPPGWRALTQDETRRVSSTRVGGEGPYSGSLANFYVVDTRSLGRSVFNCKAEAVGTLEVIDPAKSPESVENFRTFARVHLRGGRYRLVNGTEETFIDILTDVPVQPEAESDVQFVHLRDRDAYLWRVGGTVYQEPAKASMFYTTYADVGLVCVAVVEPEEEAMLTTFDQAMRGLTIVDGEQHPQPLSIRALYVRWWPTTNPALQLYWLPLPLFLIAGYLVLKD
ncbi:MAG: hypothetical protein H6739_26595 [Alphaproteobacteria bacterium]|nr:hypothetical protein [Alphaproteobacteria bacterium]